MHNFITSKPKKVTKGTILLRAGEVAKETYMVNKGCLKSYVLDANGKEHIIQFAPEGWLISNLDSFINELPSSLFIEAIEDTELSFFIKSDFPDINTLEKGALLELNIKFQNNLIATNKRIIGLLSYSSQQRYNEFTETYPSLVKRLPLKLIASYIGVTPEYLSEIRRKIIKK